MPYILNGEVMYNCSVNTAVSNDLGCYLGEGQSQWVNCQQSEGTLLSTVLFDLEQYLLGHFRAVFKGVVVTGLSPVP